MTASARKTSELAKKKFKFLLAVAKDSSLPKLANRLAPLLAIKYMRAEHGAEAFARVSTYCADLQISSESKIRAALHALVEAKYLTAFHEPGKVTRYSIASQYEEAVDGPPQDGAGSDNTPPHSGADTPPQEGAYSSPHSGADTPPHSGATKRSKREKEIERKKLKEKNARKARSSDLFNSNDQHHQTRSLAFQKFWDSWPYKVGKVDAERAFAKVSCEADAIIQGVERYISSKPHDRRWMNPATFLNGRRWEDSPATSSQSQTQASITSRRNAPDSMDVYRRFGVDLGSINIEDIK